MIVLCFLELALACSVSNYCYYVGGARSKGLATVRNVSKLHPEVPKLLRN